MQTKIHCRKHIKCKTAKQRPDETTTTKSNRNITSMNNGLHAVKRLTQPKPLVGKIVNNSKEARHLASTQRVKRKR